MSDYTEKKILKQADKIALQKERFDATVWERVSSLTEQLATANDSEREAIISEISAITKANLFLEGKFASFSGTLGQAMAPAPTNLLPSGVPLSKEDLARVGSPVEDDPVESLDDAKGAPVRRRKAGASAWDGLAAFFNAITECEGDDMAAMLDLLDIEARDSVLDVCCGTGRLAVAAAKRAKRVTAFDSSQEMLAVARANALSAEISNIDFRLLDWDCVMPGQNVRRHDVVIASRCPAIEDLDLLAALARRRVVLITFADGPSIPAICGVLFSGCKGAPEGPVPRRTIKPEVGDGSWFDTVVKVREAGWAPNVRVVPDRFVKVFDSRKEAVEFVCALRPDLSAGNEQRVAANVAPFIKTRGKNCELRIESQAAVIWFDVK